METSEKEFTTNIIIIIIIIMIDNIYWVLYNGPGTY